MRTRLRFGAAASRWKRRWSLRRIRHHTVSIHDAAPISGVSTIKPGAIRRTGCAEGQETGQRALQPALDWAR